MTNASAAFAGGLVRLLADHLWLRYQLEVTLWTSRKDIVLSQRQVLFNDHTDLCRNINAIGARFAEMGGTPPCDLGEMAPYCSVKPLSDARSFPALIRSVRSGHLEIAEGISIIRAIIPFSGMGDDQMLTALSRQHLDTAARIGALTAPSGGEGHE